MRIIPVYLLASTVLLAQPATRLTCDSLPRDSACLILEAPVPFAGSLEADTGGNGGISVESWDGPGVWARWQIRAYAESFAAAWQVAQEVRVSISDGQIRASGPANAAGRTWSVTYEVFVPGQADLSLETLNGAIGIAGVRGKLRFRTVNGAIAVNQVGGDVAGATVNGALAVALGRNGWEGEGMSLQTVNGAATVAIPAVYSAHIEMSNRIGHVVTNLPVPVEKVGLLGHRIEFGEGPGIRITAVNGSMVLTGR
jgi:hypothetical protein